MKLERIFISVFVVLAVLAGIIALAGASGVFSAPTGSSSIALAKSTFDLQSATSDNVYQQQVSALWGVRDMLQVTAEQNATIIKGQAGIASLTRGVLIVIVLLMGLVGLVAGFMFRNQKAEAAPADGASEEVVTEEVQEVTDFVEPA